MVYLFENKIVFDSLWEIDIKLLFLLSYFWIAICSVKIMLALNLHLLEVYSFEMFLFVGIIKCNEGP